MNCFNLKIVVFLHWFYTWNAMIYSKTLEGRIAARIARKQSAVLLRRDFDDLGGYDQVGRALLDLTRKGKLIKIGYGLYAKAKVSKLTGKTVPLETLPTLARKALGRLGIAAKQSQAERDYEQGRSTQVPTGRLIGVNKRISRKISYNNIAVQYERCSE
jgi:hypothetical protein